MDALWLRADAQGVPRLSPISHSADFSAGCQSPYVTEFYSGEDVIMWMHRRKPKQRLWRFHGGASHLNHNFDDEVFTSPRRYFTATLPCRKCPVCLRHRAKKWRERSKVELVYSTRTWFATFTINPHNRFLIDVKRSRNGDDTTDDSFLGRHAQISREFTLYFKRLRKKTRAPLRYLLVAECHKDGWPHYHALIHERGRPVTKRELEAEWSLGFTNFKLCPLSDPKIAFYITKYIAKQALARIRASLRYGAP